MRSSDSHSDGASQKDKEGKGFYSLDFPKGDAVALPSVRTSQDEEAKIDRKFYGGAGDKKHLGGFVEIDLQGISPAVWKHMVTHFGIKSLLDIGCGRGISTTWFLLHGVNALCVEGSHDARQQTMLPDPDKQMVEHDFSRGPWWPPTTVDAIWCVEFLEHVGRNFHKNYLPAFRKAALIFVTASRWGGYHHVEVHYVPWWVQKFELYGFQFSKDLTTMVQKIAQKEKQNKNTASPTGETYNAQHVWLNMMVFVNPAVGALPQHAHLFPEHGCFKAGPPGGLMEHRECGTGKNGDGETPLPKEFYPIELTDAMDNDWEELVKRNIQPSK